MMSMSIAPGPNNESPAPAPATSAHGEGSSKSANADASANVNRRARGSTMAPDNQRERGFTVAPDSSRDVAQEDFLFHLYRGSELLQENRVLEAKEELEFALTMQPLDAKGQDLLGAVYFRVGLYPRAIQIWEGLATQFPRDVAVKVNLALCYLKTGQPEPARRTLRDAVELNPQHKRAWGYLGLALQKLGELEQAQIAFERGGHAMMAKRLMERRMRPSGPPLKRSPSEIDDRVRSVAEEAFSEIETGELPFALAEPVTSLAGDETWHTLELGDAGQQRPSRAPTTPPPPQWRAAARPATSRPGARGAPPGWGNNSARGAPAPLIAPLDQPLVKHSTDVLLVRIEDGQSFAVRLDALRVISGTSSTRALHRRSRDAQTNEVLGGIGSPLVRVAGATQLVLAAHAKRELAVVTLDDETACVLEDLLLAFELGLDYECGRVRLDAEGGGGRSSPEAGSMTVQLRGSGALVLELAGKLGGVPCTSGRPLLVRREWVIGWLGHLVARALPPAESPNGQRGLVSFAGEGTVLLCTG
jgi:uncharacterized protein (AIM24 family)